MNTRHAFIHHQFEEQVRQTPDRTAVVFEGHSLTYEELNQRANRLAHHLCQLGVGHDVRVGICMERSFEMVTAIFAVLKAGGAYVPLDPDYPKDRLEHLLTDSQASVVLTQQQLAQQFTSYSGTLLAVDEAGALPVSSQDTNANLDIPMHEQHLAYVYYTSGSTGKPKGVMVAHSAIRSRLAWLQETFQIGEADRVLQKSPYSFDVAVWEFLSLIYGACLVVAKPKGHLDNAYLWSLLDREQITIVQFVPTMLQTFLAEQAVELPHLRHVIVAGEALTASLHARFCRMMSAQLHNLYGPTETTIFATGWTSDLDTSRNEVPIGKALSGGDVYILNERYEKVAPGEVGELYISGAGLARGYLNRPDLTAERFVPDPFSSEPGARMYETGDLARWLPDKSVECLGRNDDQVKLRGYRIELGEISTMLEEHPNVRQAVVIVREDHPGDQRLAAYYMPDATSAPSVSELRAYLQDRLPEYMVPSYLVEMEQFPLTPSGKTDRKALPSPVLSRDMISGGYTAPESYIQEELCNIWSAFFNLDRIGIDDDFIDLGGHSLVATQILVRIQQTLDVKVSLKDMLTKGKTIRALAELVEESLLADTDEQELEQLMREMEQMSEDELAALMK